MRLDVAPEFVGEALDAVEHRLSGVPADRAVRTVADHFGERLKRLEVVGLRLAGGDAAKDFRKLRQSVAAGHALAAGLKERGVELTEEQRYGALPRRRGFNAAHETLHGLLIARISHGWRTDG